MLASNAIAASTYSSFCYSIARTTFLNLQPEVEVPFGSRIALNVIPAFFALMDVGYKFAQASSIIEPEKDAKLFLDYGFYGRFLIPTAVTGIFTFMKRYLVELAVCTST
jgi:hypothetical protein